MVSLEEMINLHLIVELLRDEDKIVAVIFDSPDIMSRTILVLKFVPVIVIMPVVVPVKACEGLILEIVDVSAATGTINAVKRIIPIMHSIKNGVFIILLPSSLCN